MAEKTFGERLGALIKDRREAAGLSQEKLARAAIPEHADPTTKARWIREIEAGRVDDPQPRTYRPVCRALGISDEDVKALKTGADPGSLAPDTGTVPPRAIPVIGLPSGRAVIGREGDLEKLRANLLRAGEVQVTNSGAILSGQGGIGKTTLARAYAAKYAEDYDGVLWVAAETRARVIEGLMHLCAPLGLQRPEQPQEGDAVDVLTALQGSGQTWLIVYDNVETRDDIRQLIPRGAHLIATTRQGEGWTGFAAQETDVLGFDKETGAAVKLLMDEARREDDAAGARDLAEALGGLPLALVMAGGLIRKEGLGFGEYLGQVSRIIAAEPKNADYPDSVIGAVRLSYDKLDADARLVADLFAWWAPEGLEARLITDAPEGTQWGAIVADVPDAAQELAKSPERVAAALAALEERSILRREDGGFSLHRMSAAALRAMQGETPLNGAAAALLAAVYPADPRISETWPACRRLTPHVRALWDSGRAPGIAAMHFLLNQAGGFLGLIADYGGYAEMARASLMLKEARLPESDRNVAVGHANLGVAMRRLGDLDEAEAALRRALALDEEHRPESRDMADSREMLGGVLLDRGRGGDRAALVDALRQRQRAAALWRRLVPRASDERAQVLNNLGTVRDALGQGAAALRLSGYSLNIRRRVLPPGDARLGYGLVGTGATALKTGAAARAEPLLQEALALWQAVYVESPRHPDIVLAARWLVSCLLVRARAGEEAAERDARARKLCAEFGLEFAEMQEAAARISYDRAEGAP